MEPDNRTPPLTLTDEDRTGVIGADLQVNINRVFKHSGNGKNYRVEEIVWIANLDEWGLRFVELDEYGDVCQISVVRSHNEFFGQLSNGQTRMIQV